MPNIRRIETVLGTLTPNFSLQLSCKLGKQLVGTRRLFVAQCASAVSEALVGEQRMRKAKVRLPVAHMFKLRLYIRRCILQNLDHETLGIETILPIYVALGCKLR